MARYVAAIVGLGQVGLLFDQDSARRGVWTHFTAYQRLPEMFALAAVCDPDPDRRALAAQRMPSLVCYPDLETMLDQVRPDVVSLCTPEAMHTAQILQCVGRTRAVLCEKPLGQQDAEEALAACRRTGTWLAVNYYKRFDGCVPSVKEYLDEGRLGDVHTATALYSGPLGAVGSHALDLLRFLLPPLRLAHVNRTSGNRLKVLYDFGQDGVAMLRGLGPRHDLVFEIDLVGPLGRVRILDNCSKAEWYSFLPSRRYGGYRELFLEPGYDHVRQERFLPMFVEMWEALEGRRTSLTCDGVDAAQTQMMIAELEQYPELPVAQPGATAESS